MPVNRSAVLTFEVESVVITGSGACDVTLITKLGDEFLRRTFVQIPAETCASVWQSLPTPELSRWEDLRGELYRLLEEAGEIPTAESL
jgi:hypothetical protein